MSLPDQQFLRKMSGHEEALLMMANDAAHAKGIAVREEAEQLHAKGDKAQHLMITKLRSHFMDSYQAKVTPDDRPMVEALKQKSGPAYDTAFRENTLRHHLQSVQIIDSFLPMLRRPEFRQMAEDMKADRMRELAKLKRQLGRS